MAHAINLGVTLGFGKDNQWAWRVPIVVIQLFPSCLCPWCHVSPKHPTGSYLRNGTKTPRKRLSSSMGRKKRKIKSRNVAKSARRRNRWESHPSVSSPSSVDTAYTTMDNYQGGMSRCSVPTECQKLDHCCMKQLSLSFHFKNRFSKLKMKAIVNLNYRRGV